jgi:16S rRNA processing protein RimM
MDNNLIYVAKIGKTVGLKGELKFYIDSDFATQFKPGITFITNKSKKLTIQYVNLNKQSIKFIGIDNIEDAKKIVNQQLFSTKDDTIKNCTLDNNQYFWFDIIGCKIFENGELLGEVIDIQRFAIDDYLIIKTDNKLVLNNKAKTFLIPYINRYIISVNISNKQIITKDTLEILDNS